MGHRRSPPQPLEHQALSILHSARLTLRRPRLDDISPVHRYAVDPRASRFLAWVPHHAMDDTLLFLRGCIEAWQGEQRLPWVIEVGGDVVGMIEAKLQGRNAGIGYVLSPDAWGHGYASEALGVISEALFRHSPVSAIWALCVMENLASARVLERSGYRRERLIPKYFPCPNIDNKSHDVWRYVRYRHPSKSVPKAV